MAHKSTNSSINLRSATFKNLSSFFFFKFTQRSTHQPLLSIQTSPTQCPPTRHVPLPIEESTESRLRLRPHPHLHLRSTPQSLQLSLATPLSRLRSKTSTTKRTRLCGPDALRIGTSSTYCGFKTFMWDARPSQLQQSNKELTHLEGCNFDLSDCSREDLQILQQPRESPSLSHEDKHNTMQKFQELKDIEVSEKSGNSSSSWADGTETWFQKWKSFLATAIAAGAGAGAAGMTGGFWMSAGGISVKGPLGFSMAAGYATAGGFGAVGAAGVGSAVAAYAMVYFIPWDHVWDFLRAKLWQIWDKIWGVLLWIKDKLAELASTVLTKVSFVVQGVPKPARLSM